LSAWAAFAQALAVEVASIGEIRDAAIGQSGERILWMDGVLEEGFGRVEQGGPVDAGRR
jgi:hypothetical protein